MSGEKRLLRGAQGVRGAQGNQGNRGERGERGLSPVVRRSLALLFILMFALTGACLLFTAHYVSATQQAARREGAVVERKICTTLGRIAALQPPPGNPLTNPSRAYEQRLHATLAQLGPDLGCG